MRKQRTEYIRKRTESFSIAGLLSTFILIWLALLPGLCLGATYYVAASGTSGTGTTPDDPIIATGNAILSLGARGDVIYLQDGYYGEIDTFARVNSDYITIQAQPGHTPGFKRIRLRLGSKWVFKGLTISRELASTYEIGSLFYAENCNDIIIENNSLYSKQDSSGWTLDDWRNNVGYYIDGGANTAKTHGVYFRASCSNIIVRNNTVKNIYSGIIMDGSNALVEYNSIENFAGDGLVGNGDDQVWQYNIVKNSYDIDTNHDDLLQIAPGPNYRIEIRGNILISGPDPSNPLLHGAQGIGLWDGPNYNIVIENNIVISTHIMGGISLFDGQNSKIINNIVFNPLFGTSGYATYIRLGSKGHGGNNNITIRNNISHSFPSSQGTIYSDHNMDIDNYNLDDLFVNYSNFDYRHKAGSPAIDTGSDILAPDTDIAGNPRPYGIGYDIGAYEYTEGAVFMYGDINGNGEVTSYDAALVARYAVGMETFTDEQRQRADVSGNGAVSAYDAALIAQRAVGLIERFPVEE